jgi:hypothetical protein
MTKLCEELRDDLELSSTQSKYIQKIKQNRKPTLKSNELDYGSIALYNNEKFTLWIEKPEGAAVQKSAVWGNFYRDAQGNIYPNEASGTEHLPALFLNNTGTTPEENFPVFEMGLRPDGEGGQKGVVAFYGKDDLGALKQLASIELNAFNNITTKSVGAENKLSSADQATEVDDIITVENNVTNEGTEFVQTSVKDVSVLSQNLVIPDVRSVKQSFLNTANSGGISNASNTETYNLNTTKAEFTQSGDFDNATQEIAHEDTVTNSRNSIRLTVRNNSSTFRTTNRTNWQVNNVKLMVMSSGGLNEPYDPDTLIGLDDTTGIYLNVPNGAPATIAGLDENNNMVSTPVNSLYEGIDKQIEELEAENEKIFEQINELRQLIASKFN